MWQHYRQCSFFMCLLFHFNSSCFWWVTPSTTEREHTVLTYSWHSWRTMPLVPIVRLVTRAERRESKNHFVFRVDRELLWSGFCLRQMQSEKVEHLCGRLQLPKMDLQSYQVGGCWRCNTWSPLSPLWQHTGPDHWRWLGDLSEREIGRGREMLLQQANKFYL